MRIRVRTEYDMLRICTRIDLGNLEGERTPSDASRFRDIVLFLMGTVYLLVEGIRKQKLEGNLKRIDVLNIDLFFVYYHHWQEQ